MIGNIITVLGITAVSVSCWMLMNYASDDTVTKGSILAWGGVTINMTMTLILLYMLTTTRGVSIGARLILGILLVVFISLEVWFVDTKPKTDDQKRGAQASVFFGTLVKVYILVSVHCGSITDWSKLTAAKFLTKSIAKPAAPVLREEPRAADLTGEDTEKLFRRAYNKLLSVLGETNLTDERKDEIRDRFDTLFHKEPQDLDSLFRVNSIYSQALQAIPDLSQTDRVTKANEFRAIFGKDPKPLNGGKR